MLTRARCVTVLAIACGPIATATAQPAARPRVAIGALGELGDARSNHRVFDKLESAIAALGIVEVIGKKAVERSLRRAKKPHLLSCEGDSGCLAEMGRTTGATWVVGAEVGGLGAVKVFHLKLISSSDGKSIRSATSELVNETPKRAALIQLLAPKLYRGELRVVTEVVGAEIVVDARVVAKTPTEGLMLPVGTHALRVTHPDYRDDVRFVDIAFEKATSVEIAMTRLRVSRNTLERSGSSPTGPVDGGADRPWYGRWYVVAGIGATILIGSAAIWAATTDSLDFDKSKDL